MEKQTLGRTLRLNLCVNAFAGERAWYCYDFGGRKTAGKEKLDAAGRCEACALALAGLDNPPSFMENEE